MSAVPEEVGTALEVAPRRPTLMRAIAPVKELIEAQKEVASIVRDVLTEGEDYGIIKGTKRQTLYKAGAERVCVAFGCVAEYEVIEREADHNAPVTFQKKKWNNAHRDDKTFTMVEDTTLGLYRYVVRCNIRHMASGSIVGYGLGVASTLESKYSDRPRELENTIAKMASKRAHVAATLNAFALSDRFTQDMEDSVADPHTTGEAAPPAPADSVPNANPREVLPPPSYPAKKKLGEWTVRQVEQAVTYFNNKPEVAEYYPVFRSALMAVYADVENPARGETTE